MGKDQADSSAATTVAVVLLAILGIGLVGLLICGVVGFFFVQTRSMTTVSVNSSSATYVDAFEAPMTDGGSATTRATADGPATGERGQAEAALAKFRKDLEAYRSDVDSYPTTVEGLIALLDRPDDLPKEAKWEGPYAERIPADPWGQAYRYECDGQAYVRVWSMGPDGIDGTADDIQIQITSSP